MSSLRKKMKKIGVKGGLKTFDPGGGAHHGPSVVISGPRFFVLFSLFFLSLCIRVFTDRGGVCGGSKKPFIIFLKFFNF